MEYSTKYGENRTVEAFHFEKTPDDGMHRASESSRNVFQNELSAHNPNNKTCTSLFFFKKNDRKCAAKACPAAPKDMTDNIFFR
ncbi:MAG: hypothetical protein ACNI3A_15520 [Desulfovibrio sp.]|uniref:hypothetical protein n=1 Tax=Desulfovibrio sp. 7SRBS1 TaxID=3378064 RepID=UPI003B3EEB70